MSTVKNQTIKCTTVWLCVTALFTVLNVAMSSFSIPVPGGHLYMNDIIYSTPEYAVLKLPYQILQAGVGAVLGMLLCWKCGLVKLFYKIYDKKSNLF